MTRYTKAMKEQTINRLLAHRYTDTVLEIRVRRKALFDDVYLDAFGRKKIDLMNSMEPGMFKGALSGRVVFGATYADIRPDGVEHAYDVNATAQALFGLPGSKTDDPSRSVRIPANKDGTVWARYEATHNFSTRYHAIVADWDRLTEEVRSVKRKAYSVIEYCRTTEKAVEKWPEIEPFIKFETSTAPDPSTALTIRTEDLNKALGLPVDEI